MLGKILIVVVLIILGIVGYAAFQPKEYSVQREVTIDAPPQVVFPWINNSKKMGEWMPWSEMDPKMVMTYSGPEEGVGATSSWQSDGKMGVGEATIIEIVPNQVVKTKLEYTKPFEGTQMAEISITPSGSQSVVKWSVQGENNLIGRIMCLFMNMQKMVGGSFEKGLAKLKQKVESGGK